MKTTFRICLLPLLMAAVAGTTFIQRAVADTNQLAVFTYAGLIGTNGSSDGVGTNAEFYYPCGVVPDTAGNLYVADTVNNTIRQINPAAIVTTIAGTAGVAGTNDGIGSVALFNSPLEVTIDRAGNLYVADAGNDTIRELVAGGGTNWVVSTVAGMPGIAGTNDGVGNAARFSQPYGVALDNFGNLYVADKNNNTIRKMSLSGTNWVVSTLAGLAGVSGSANGTNGTAKFNSPRNVATDGAGNIYVADWDNSTVRKVTPLGVVTTLAGDAGVVGTNDGVGTAARFNKPHGLTVDSATNVYVADFYNCTIRKITPAGAVTTIAGLPGVAGGANGTGTNAEFNDLCSLTMNESGVFYIADSANNSIRKAYYNDGQPVVYLEPQSADFPVDSNLTFTVAASGLNPIYQWVFDGTNLPNATNASLTITDAQLANAGDYTVVTTNLYGSTTNPVLVLTVVVPPTVSTNPVSVTVLSGGSVTMSVTALGGGLSYQWALNGTNIAGATNATLTISDFSQADVGSYTVTVSNVAGSVTSQPAIAAGVNIQMSSGTAGIIVWGLLGSSYLIQAESNLYSNNWITLTNITLPSQPYIYTDYSSTTNRQQFYRVVLIQ